MVDTLTWTYNPDFTLSSFTYAGATQSYGYDADGLLTSAAPFTISRDASSGLAASVTTTGFALARTYNAYGEIDAASYGGYAYALTRDAAGRIASRTETTSGAPHRWAYAYDTLGRLTSATRDGILAESYAYDANGNRTSYRAPLRGITTTQTSTFDAEDRALTSASETLTFTADGYIASRTSSGLTTSYAYTTLGELSSVTPPTGPVVSYRYDAHGARVAKLVGGVVTETYEWAGPSQLLAVYDGSGALQARFLYADARVPYAVDEPSGRYFLAYDQVGSLRAVTDSSGALVRAVERDSFGNVISDSAPSVVAWLGFAGGLADGDTGLTLFGARDYDPALGRWMSKDPIGFGGGDADLYGYCLGDPVNGVDPSGLSCGCGDVGAPASWRGLASVQKWQEGASLGVGSGALGGVDNGWLLTETAPVDTAGQLRSSGSDPSAAMYQRQAFVACGHLSVIGAGPSRVAWAVPLSFSVWGRPGWASPGIGVVASAYAGTGMDVTLGQWNHPLSKSQSITLLSPGGGVGTPFVWAGLQISIPYSMPDQR